MTNYWKIKKDITIVQGKAWYAKFRWLAKSCNGKTLIPVNMTGYTGKMVIRECVEDSVALLEVTSLNGLTITPLTGAIEIDLSATQTNGLTAGNNVYEIELETNSKPIGFATGKAIVYEEIAK